MVQTTDEDFKKNKFHLFPALKGGKHYKYNIEETCREHRCSEGANRIQTSLGAILPAWKGKGGLEEEVAPS